MYLALIEYLLYFCSNDNMNYKYLTKKKILHWINYDLSV